MCYFDKRKTPSYVCTSYVVTQPCKHKDHNCDQVCLDLGRDGYTCDCLPGYRLLSDGLSCSGNHHMHTVYV